MSTGTETASAGALDRALPDFLTRDPDGEVRLTGHRIGLYSIVERYRRGHSGEQIREEFPSLPLSHIYKVLAFYLENRPEVDAYADAYGAELDRQAAEPPGPGVLKVRKLMAARAQSDQR